MPNNRWVNLTGLWILAAALTVSVFCLNAYAATTPQRSFRSAEEAVKALMEAVKAGDKKEVLAIFGPGGKEVISSGDEVADREARDRFINAYHEKNSLTEKEEKKLILMVGKDQWPFPIPIVNQEGSWRFNTPEGKDEILNRRIGRNELSAIQACLAYVDAQREYALRERKADASPSYAQRFLSTKGEKDGLYWEAKEGEEQSPLGPLVAKAVEEGYTGRKPGGKPVPYHGYFYRILKAQGRNAPGGEYDYLVKGRMMGGFALVAYPAKYGVSGIMTFIVNHDGTVYEKNLGKDTAKLARAMKKFDPDKTWKKAE